VSGDAEGDTVKVQLGTFDQSVTGWINTDITWHLFIARVPLLHHVLHAVGLFSKERYLQHKHGVFKGLRYVDLTKRLPFRDQSVRVFFSSHMLEHLYPDEVEALMREMHRCLAPGGICRVVVPDLERIVRLFDRNDPRCFITELFEVTTRKHARIAHHSAFTGPLLVKLFTDAGFSKAEQLAYRKGRCPDIELLDNRPEESLYVEAVK